MVRFLFLLFLAFTLSSGNNNLYAQDDEIISLKLITGDTILKEEGSPKYQIQIQSSKPVSADVNLLITFNSITAQSNDVSYTQVVKLDAGTSNSAPIDINAVDDAVYEDIETFYLLPQITLGPGTVSDDTLFFSIIDNEPPLVSFSVDKTDIDEDGGEANYIIKLNYNIFVWVFDLIINSCNFHNCYGVSCLYYNFIICRTCCMIYAKIRIKTSCKV